MEFTRIYLIISIKRVFYHHYYKENGHKLLFLLKKTHIILFISLLRETNLVSDYNPLET